MKWWLQSSRIPSFLLLLKPGGMPRREMPAMPVLMPDGTARMPAMPMPLFVGWYFPVDGFDCYVHCFHEPTFLST